MCEVSATGYVAHMLSDLRSKTIAFITARSGVEQDELVSPWTAVEEAGGAPRLLTPDGGGVQAFRHDVEKADEFTADGALSDASPDDFDGLVLPGGTINADQLRLVPQAARFVAAFAAAHKPIAAICHGPWSLVEADVLRGKTLTSWPSLRTDIRNAGGEWVDHEVFVCMCDDWTLVTSRKPADLPAFNAQLLAALSN
jgi:protease I